MHAKMDLLWDDIHERGLSSGDLCAAQGIREKLKIVYDPTGWPVYLQHMMLSKDQPGWGLSTVQ